MNIFTHGSKHFLGQLPSIIKGFQELGHLVDVPDWHYDLIYSNDLGGYEEAYNQYTAFNQKPKLIFNCLDLPFHVNEFQDILKKYIHYFHIADKITTISYKVKKDIKEHTGFDAEVIYQPIRNVSFIQNASKNKEFFINGRVLDPNKRASLAVELSKKLNKTLVCSGSDNLPTAYNYGIVSDEGLSILYNTSKITLAFGKIEGLGMQIPESLICRTPIITLSDNLTNYEFCPPEMICEPNVDSIINKVDEILKDYINFQYICFEYAQKYSVQFSPIQIAKNILNVYASTV